MKLPHQSSTIRWAAYGWMFTVVIALGAAEAMGLTETAKLLTLIAGQTVSGAMIVKGRVQATSPVTLSRTSSKE